MKKISIFVRKLHSFARRSTFEKRWFLPVWILLGLSRLLILTVHFRRMAPWLGMRAGIDPWIPLIDPAAQARAVQIGRVIALASNYTPWLSNFFRRWSRPEYCFGYMAYRIACTSASAAILPIRA